MARQEPIKHHYIPQFILRNFCFDDRGYLLYCSKNSSEISVKKTTEVFMKRNLYRDDINIPDNPTKIEKDMACFEGEISQIIKREFLNGDEASITREEDERLKIFLAIMAFRSENTSERFGAQISNASKDFYSKYQPNEDFTDFWKRNLGNLVNCRSLREVMNHGGIDDPIKLFFCRDVFGYFGRYFIVVERRGPIDFVIGDTYPTVISGVMDSGLELELYSMFPISPDRVLLLAANGMQGAPRNVAMFSNEVLKKPRVNPDGRTITIRVRRVYENEVRYVDSMLMKESHKGFAFRDRERVFFE